MHSRDFDSRAKTDSALSRQLAEGRQKRTEHPLLWLQRQFGNRFVQRALTLSRKADSTEVSPQVEQAIERARGGGQALDSGVRAQMEPAFGADFGDVQVHTDIQADTLNRALNARAFTTGRDIFFRQGAYSPGSSSGRELMAHELTHVVQQTGTKVQPKLLINPQGDSHEQEADQVAQALVHQEPRLTSGQALSTQVGRQPEEEEEEEEPVRTRSVQRQVEEEEEEPVRTRLVQRQVEEEEEEPVRTRLVQRRTDQPQEFIPRTSADPEHAELRVFEHHIHSWRIDNRQDAPANTHFRWGWGVPPTGVLDVVGDDEQHDGATKNIWVQAGKPGNSQIQGTPVYQVPGGPRMTGETQRSEVTVQQPTLELLGIMPRKADGSGAQSDHLSPGDKLIVRVKVGNVDGRHMEDPTRVMSLSGEGYDLVSVGTRTPAQQFEDGRSYDVELIARAPGSLNLELALGIGSNIVDLSTMPSVGGITGEIEFDRQTFINLANQCDTKIARAYTRADSIMEVLSAAYGNAYESHRDTLKAQSASNQLAANIILGAALAFIPGGIGGVVGGLMKSAKVGAFMADAVKDMAKAGAKGVQGLIVSSGGAGPMRPIGTDPRTWRANRAVWVNTEKERVLDILDDWKTKANRSDPDFYLNFDPVIVTEESLVRNGQPLRGIPVPDQEEHQRLFELGMWRRWLETYAYTVASHERVCTGETYYTVQENQGKKIRDRINALGENGDQWLETYGGVARRRARSRVYGTR